MPRLKPRKICERMTPELPRAPIRAPWLARLAIAERSASSTSRMSSIADCNVRSMLVPVSPSGTGNTLSASTSSRLTVSQASEPSRASLKRRPSHSRMGMVAAPVRLWMSVAAAPADVDPPDVDVDFPPREPEGALDRVAHRIAEIVGDFRNPRAVLHDHVEPDGDAILADLDLDPPMDLVAVKPLGQAIAQAARRHGDDTITAGRGMPGDGGNHMA